MTKKKPEAAAVWCPVEDLTPWDDNPRLNDEAVGKVRDSIKRFGFAAPIVARREDGMVIAGHTRLRAAVELGLEKVPVRWMDLDPADARMLALADNKLGEVAAWDDDLLRKVLEDLASEPDLDLSGLGWEEEDLEAILGDDEPAGPDDGEVTEPPEEPDSVVGEVYELGPHRLVCGDSTDPAVFAALMQGGSADVVWTDPPYNCGGRMKAGFYAGTDSPQMKALAVAEWDEAFDIGPTLALLEPACSPDASVYVCTSQHLAGEVWAWMAKWADFHSYVVWCKPAPMPSLAKRHWTWSTELVCYATRGRHAFDFPKEGHALSHWVMGSRDGERVHPTQKPVALPLHALRHSARAGAVVLDPFGGSGSTLIACARSGRVARLVELDPGYCDVIRRRWTTWAEEAGVDPGPGALR